MTSTERTITPSLATVSSSRGQEAAGLLDEQVDPAVLRGRLADARDRARTRRPPRRGHRSPRG